MTAPMGCRLVGRWRIVEADLWDRDYLDLVTPATMTIGADGHGEIAYGAMQPSLELEYRRSMVFFTWAGFDEMDDVSIASASVRLCELRHRRCRKFMVRWGRIAQLLDVRNRSL